MEPTDKHGMPMPMLTGGCILMPMFAMFAPWFQVGSPGGAPFLVILHLERPTRPIWAGKIVCSTHAGLLPVLRCERALSWCPAHLVLHSPLLWPVLCPCV